MKLLNYEKIKTAAKNFNLLPKLAALLMAVGLWFYIGSKKIGSVSYSIPVQVINLSQDLVVADIQTKTVTVTIKGNKEELKGILRKAISVEADLRNPVIGKPARYDLTVSSSEQYENVKYELSTKKIFIVVEKKITKRVPVVPRFSGNLADGWEIVDFSVKPDFVSVSGPESMLREINEATTADVNISGEKGSFKRNAALNIKKHENITASAENIEISITGYPASEIEILNLSAAVKNDNPAYDVSVEKNDVTVFFRKSKDFSAADVSAMVDVSAYSFSQDDLLNHSGEVVRDFPVRIFFDHRKDSAFLSSFPDTVRVRIKKK